MNADPWRCGTLPTRQTYGSVPWPVYKQSLHKGFKGCCLNLLMQAGGDTDTWDDEKSGSKIISQLCKEWHTNLEEDLI